MSNDWDSDRLSFDAYLGRRNAERLQLASVYFAAVMLALIVAELAVDELRSIETIVIQIASILYFSGLAWLCRNGTAAEWRPSALQLLFGVGAITTGLLLSLYIGWRSAPIRPMRRRFLSPASRRCGRDARYWPCSCRCTASIL
jgi:hypothetical protein